MRTRGVRSEGAGRPLLGGEGVRFRSHPPSAPRMKDDSEETIQGSHHRSEGTNLILSLPEWDQKQLALQSSCFTETWGGQMCICIIHRISRTFPKYCLTSSLI